MSKKKLHILPFVAVGFSFLAGVALSLAVSSRETGRIVERFRKSEEALLRRLQEQLSKIEGDDESRRIVAACAVAKRSVVGITVRTTYGTGTGTDYMRGRYPGYGRRNYEYASGVVIDPEGYIVTNYHVVKSADKGDVTVTFWDNRKLDARVIGKDSRSDIAIIKVDAKDVPVAKLGNSEEIGVGQRVVSIGNPYGLSHSVSLGVVSALGRNLGLSEYENLIQTDAAVNPGNSGGPLINLRGEVVGICSAVAGRTGLRTGIGFAIPINMVRRIKDKLIKEGSVPRGWLGVHLQDLTPELAKSFGYDNPSVGVLVTKVQPGSPAEEAGILSEDILTAYDDKPLELIPQLRILVGQSRVGQKVKMKYFRDGKTGAAEVTIGDYDAAMASRLPPDSGYGLKVGELTEADMRSYNYHGQEGVIVTRVLPKSIADRRGMKVGMLIDKINSHVIRNMDDFDRISEDVLSSKSLRLRVRNRNQILYITLRK